jgi:hypothetical protein
MTGHRSALQLRLSHERGYLALAKSEGERELRKVWIAQIEREIEGELSFLGRTAEPSEDMSDDEILKALES